MFETRHTPINLLRSFWAAIVVFLALCSPAEALQSVLLAWNPAPDSRIAGYNIYYGVQSGVFDNEIDAGTNTSFSIPALVEGETIYFTITGYTASGVETPPCNQLVVIVPAVSLAPQTGGLQVTLNAPGAEWTVDNGALEASGATVSGLSVGSHTVSFIGVTGWTAPASQTVSIALNQTASITGTYVAIPQVGSLQVTLNVPGAQWAVDNGTLQNSGATISGLAVGSHTVTFSAVANWTTPVSQTVSIALNQTASITGTYVAIPQVGSLQVTLNVPGAQWAVDNGTLQNSGATVSGVSVGSHTVSFFGVTGWTAPVSQTVSIALNQTASITGTYVAIPQVGSLQVTLNVPGAQWAVDNGTLQNSGATISGLAVGSHTVTFSAVANWTTPVSQTVSIALNQTNSITGTYVAIPQVGSLQVTLNAPGAQWAADNGTLENSGATISGLSVGSHTVTFSAVANWTTPASQTVSIALNQTNSITGTYVAIPQVGSLQVTLNAPGAQWTVDNGALQTNGAIVSGLSVGSHTVNFSAVSGWTTPASQTVSVALNQTNSITGTYVAIPQVGSLQVTLNAPGAQWTVDNGALQTNGAIVSGLSVGSHTVNFSAVSGWTTPASQTVSVALNQTNSITGTYVAIPQVGSLQVNLNAPGSQWAVDNGTLQNSGATISGLAVGSHTVTFSAAANWTTPVSQTVSIALNQTTSITGTYVSIPQVGSLQVTLNVPGAQWAVDNGTLQNSGATVSGLSVGSHTVSFFGVTGWTAPVSQTVSIALNQTNSITGTYVAIPQVGSLQVNLNAPGAQWAVDNGALQTNGAIVSGLNLGSHTVSFFGVTGWTAPASQTVSIALNQTNSVTGTYLAIPQVGSVQVTLNAPGAQWTVDNGALQTNGAIVSGLSVGSHTVNFSAVSGWTAPASQTVSIALNQTASITGTYVAIPQVGSLQVTLNVPGAQWAVDNGTLQNSGATISGLSVGSHTVNFFGVTGWTAPASQTVSIALNQTNSVTGTYLAIPQVGSVQVTLNAPGAQWTVDNGALQTNGAIVSGLSVGSHTVNFSAVSGWTAPASQTVSIALNQTNSVTGTYLAIPQVGSVQVTLNAPGAQWTVDNGALQTNGAIVSGLSVGSHTVNFSAVSGWTAPASQTVSIALNQTNSITGTYLAIPQVGSLQVTLNVPGAQWAVDNGVLQTNGASVSGLSVGSHTVSFFGVTGWTAPASQTVSIALNQTNSVTGTYVVIPQVGSLQVTLNAPGAQWAVDNGTLQNSGAIVSGLSVGSHTVTFSAVSNWTTPASQTISITFNQTNSITGTYVAIPQVGSLQVTLNAPGAQWAVDNGTLQPSGATISGLSIGSHTVSFTAVSNWTTPTTQTISIALNQTNSITGTYVAIPQIGSLQVTLNASGAQWAVDNGTLQNSGATVSGLSVGSHTVTFSAVSNWTTPASQTVSIALNQTNSITGTYVAIPQIGSLQVTLNALGAQWTVDNGPLQSSGAIVSGLSVGSHTVTFSAVANWTTPANQTVSIALNQTNSIMGTYVAIPQVGSLQVTLNALGAQWTVDNGPLQSSGAIVSGLSVGSHTVTFSAVANWTTPVSQTISIALNQTNSITGTYVAIPQVGSLQVTLNAPGAQWTVDNGPLQSSGATVSGLLVGSHTVGFSAVSGWTMPASQTVAIGLNQTNSISATYVVISQIGSLKVTLNAPGAQWAVDNETLQASGATVSGLSVGSHTITFSDVNGWTTPASQTAAVALNKTTAITASYVAIPQIGALQVNLNAPGAQWAVDNGALHANGATVAGLSVGSHTVTFSTVATWTTPASQTVSIALNQTNSITGTYVAIPQVGSLQVTLNAPGGQWAVDNGTLQASGSVVSGLSVGSHTITFNDVSGWTTPASQTAAVALNKTTAITATYVAIPQIGALQVNLNAPGAQWAVDNGALHANGATVAGLSVGSHTVTFSTVANWTTPVSQTISIAFGQTNSITATYVAIPQVGSLQVNLNAPGAQWAVDNGELQASGSVVSGLSLGSHTITFSDVSDWTTPASQTVNIAFNKTNSITATYVAIPQVGALQVNLNAPGAQWAVDNGALHANGATVSGIAVGSHTVTFSTVATWTTPASQTVSIALNQTNSITATYVAIPQVGSLQVTLNAPGAQWAVDNGTLQNSGAIVSGLSVGSHTVSFSTVSNWTTPANQTATIALNKTTAITATYVAIPQVGSLQVTLNSPGAQWAVDSGALHASGATVSGLSVGLHTVSFSTVANWTTPASQTISIAFGQTNSITATYVAIPQVGSLQVNLNAPGAQWAVDNGALQPSGATVSSLSVGSHTITYSDVSGWTTPASQTATVAFNKTTSITATYVAIPQVGGLQVTLNAPGAQWAVDNGTLQASGATVSGLAVGSHTLTFSAVSGWTKPASQSVSITLNQTTTLAATYVAIPQVGALQVTLNAPGAQWAVDNGNLQPSGAIISSLSVGLHTVTFSGVDGWTTPSSQTVSVMLNETNSISATYVAIPLVGSLQVTLNAPGAQWEVDNGALQDSGATVSGLSIGSHIVSFTSVSGWTMPTSQTVSIALNQTNSILATYVVIPPTGLLQVSLNAPGQWAVDSGAWQNSGSTVSGLSVGDHTVSFSDLAGWTTPTNQTISIALDQTTAITGNYAAMPQVGSLQVTLNAPGAQWAVDNGPLQGSGATVSGLSVANHTVTFSSVSGWTTPASQIVSIIFNQTNSVAGTYAAIPQIGALQVTLNAPGAQWAIDNGAFQNSGDIVTGLSMGNHTLSFSSVADWTTPLPQTVSIALNQTNSTTATYVAIPQVGALQVTLNAPGAQWSVDNGTFQTNGAIVASLSLGSHTVSFSSVDGWVSPTNQTVAIALDETNAVTGTYVAIPQVGSLQVTLNAPGAQWAVDNGELQNSGDTVTNLPVGTHVVTFTTLSGWATPAGMVLTVSADQTTSMRATYMAALATGAVQVTFPVGAANAGGQWSVDNGIWQGSGTTVAGLMLGTHSLAFTSIAGWISPTNYLISIGANQTNSILANYVSTNGTVQVALNAPGAQWSVDNGALQNGGSALAVAAGKHTITFTAVNGWTAPASQTVTVIANQTLSLTGTYVSTTGSLEVTLNIAGQWALDNGAWQTSGAIVRGIPAGNHTVTFTTVTGWTAPASQTVSIAVSQTNLISAAYALIPQTGSLQVTMNAPGGQWAVDNGALQTSGAIISGLGVGNHTVTFSSVTGWITPASQAVTIAFNQTNSIAGNYALIPQTGSLQLTLNAPGAQWAVDNSAFQSSGSTVSNLSIGAHTVTFNNVNGWTSPANQTVAVAANQTTSITPAYIAIPQIGALKVTISPASAQWSVDNGALQNNAAVVSGLSAGSHSVHFTTVSGWVTPNNQTVAIAANATNQIVIAYVAVPPPTYSLSSYAKAVKGTYNGLFYPENGVTAATAGMISGLTIQTNGKYTGKLVLNGSSLPISGTFGTNARANQIIARTSKLGGNLVLEMGLAWNGNLVEITGTVSGTNGGAWSAPMLADAAAVSGISRQYTLLIPPAATAPANSPPGFGYATITKTGGTAAVAGALADATTFSQSVAVSADGSIPLYVAINATEMVMGWITNLYGEAPAGEIIWIKQGSSKSVNYKGGFTNGVAVLGSIWTPPAAKQPAMALTSAPLAFQDGGLALPIDFFATVEANNSVIKSGTSPTNTLTGTVNPKNGLIQLTFGNGNGNAKETAYGAVLQNLQTAAGYFMNGANGGVFEFGSFK